jgi:hypothetical protein
MLQAILAEFKHSQNILSLTSLSQKLGVEPSALEGMLCTLVRKGRIIELTHDDDACQICPLHERCTPGTTEHKLYMLPPDTLHSNGG